jgi:hypothetical protein
VTYEKLGDCKVVDGHPYWSSPVVLCSVIELVALAQTPDTVRTPELFLVLNEIQDGAKSLAVLVDETSQEGEQRDIALMTDKRVLLVVVDSGIAVRLCLVRPM